MSSLYINWFVLIIIQKTVINWETIQNTIHIIKCIFLNYYASKIFSSISQILKPLFYKLNLYLCLLGMYFTNLTFNQSCSNNAFCHVREPNFLHNNLTLKFKRSNEAFSSCDAVLEHSWFNSLCLINKEVFCLSL